MLLFVRISNRFKLNFLIKRRNLSTNCYPPTIHHPNSCATTIANSGGIICFAELLICLVNIYSVSISSLFLFSLRPQLRKLFRLHRHVYFYKKKICNRLKPSKTHAETSRRDKFKTIENRFDKKALRRWCWVLCEMINSIWMVSDTDFRVSFETKTKAKKKFYLKSFQMNMFVVDLNCRLTTH